MHIHESSRHAWNSVVNTIIVFSLLIMGCGDSKTATVPSVDNGGLAATASSPSPPPPPAPAAVGDVVSTLAIPAANSDQDIGASSPPPMANVAPAAANAGTGAIGADGSFATFEDGKAVFVSNRCGRCHTIAGVSDSTPENSFATGRERSNERTGPGNRMRGPELTHVGRNPEHTVDWLAAHVRNPKSHNPRSRMPSFQGRISDKDIYALATYLASLK